jgi:hypothetical protein
LLSHFCSFAQLQEIILPRKFRTTTSGIPSTPSKKHQNGNGIENGSVNGKDKETPMGNLLTRQSLKTYETANHMILYKYAAYGGTCGDLPK